LELAMKPGWAIILGAAALLVAAIARSGHEQPVYPSYYPHEIEIAAMAPQRAAELMRAGKLHAYVGRAPAFAAAPADTIGSVESLGAFIVIRLNPDSALAKDEASSCAAAGAIVRDMATRAGGNGLIVHPYPVTPFHGDYLHHADLAGAAIARFSAGGADASPSVLHSLKVRADGALAQSLIRPEWRAEGPDWDAAIAEVGASDLVASTSVAMNGWLAPRWTRTGWFHAHRLLAGSISEPERKQRVDADLARLQAGEIEGAVARIDLERALVGSLTAGCRALVVGYTVKREYFNAEFSAGIENIGFDALEGLHSPIFLRTVKLKDFPWNGWLQLGISQPPAAAWNPIGGFTDDFGRLMWVAVGDAAAIPSPYEATWMLNRISEVEQMPRR
jgi:hypothetical protein